MAAIAELLRAAIADLAGSDSAALDAELLLSHCLGRDRTYLYTWPERAVPEAVQANFAALLARRRAGEPVAYLLGRREFWSLPLKVSPATLIPRPDTETLVQQALQIIDAGGAAMRVLDLGCGSGAIALALASERPALEIVALDNAADALAVAEGNAAALGIDNVRFLRSDWYSALGDEVFDVILSNPPYIAAGDPLLRQGDVRFEPLTALVADEQGLADIRCIVASAAAHLRPGGSLWLEHGYTQATAVRALLREQQCFEPPETIEDIAGRDRVTGAKFCGGRS